MVTSSLRLSGGYDAETARQLIESRNLTVATTRAVAGNSIWYYSQPVHFFSSKTWLGAPSLLFALCMCMMS